MPGDMRAISNRRGTSNITILLIASALLLVAIGVIAMLPEARQADPADLATTAPAQNGEAVTRVDTTLLNLNEVSASQAVSQQLRQPIRLTDSNANRSDLRKLTAAVLSDFGHQSPPGDRLLHLLVQALSEGQSNAYIDALLNTAAARGDFTAPRQLLTASGRLDTETLLTALVRQAQI